MNDLTNTMQNEQNELEPRSIETITQEIQYYKTQVGTGILEIGRRLIEAKRVLPQGEWLPYLKDTVEFSERTAQNFMRIAREYSNPQLVADLGAAKAVCLLALTEGEREAVLSETHEVDGEEKSVFEMSKREVERLTKEIAEERKKSETLNFEWDEKMKESDRKHEDAITAARAERDALKRELEDLRNQPPPTVVAELDEASISKIQKEAADEAAEKFRKKEEKLKKQIEAAEKSLKDAKKAEEESKQRAEEAEGKVDELAMAVSKAEKELRMAGDKDVAKFKVYFDDCQEKLDEMREVISILKQSGNDDGAEKLAKAMCALCDQAKAAAENEVKP